MTRGAASLILSVAIGLSGLLSQPARAQQADAHLALDLNALQPSQNGCRLTFVVANNLATPIDRAAFEMALFSKDGVVDRLSVLDFKGLPTGKTKVSRFDLSGVKCETVGRVLINDATACEGAGTAADACIKNLRTTSTSGLQFGR